MRSRGWRWYVFGAQAVVAWGRPRMTADVDVAVDIGDADKLELVRLLGQHGFEERFALSEEFLRDARLLPMLHRPTAMPADVVLLASELQREFLDRTRSVDVGGQVVPVVCPEDLLVMKLLAARRKDLEDARGIAIEQWQTLDVGLVRRVISLLGDPKVLRRLERVLRQAKNLV